MKTENQRMTRREARLKQMDEAAFGVIYGSITVLSILLAFGKHPESALHVAIILVGSVTAILLAKAFAEVMARGIEHEVRPSRHHFAHAWRHVSTAFAAVNTPVLFLLLASMEFMGVEVAIKLSQVFCIALLLAFGARVGWVADRAGSSALLGAAFAGGLGTGLSILKYLIH